jgi:catechol 2,3-dioxygenase-like lactoylglutathione lyase family enzyme
VLDEDRPAPAEQPRRMALRGLHHVTAICRDLERTTAFYRDLLGLPLVREDANPDDPDARHFWFGSGHAPDGDEGANGGSDGAGRYPGSLVSFMEYPEMPQGQVGVGSTHHFAFVVDTADEQEAWRDYLREHGVSCTDVFDRGGFASIYLRDPDGHIVEIATRGPGSL